MNQKAIRRNLLIVFLILIISLISCKQDTGNPLRVSDINPRYFTDSSGKAIYLTGSHTWNNLVDMHLPSGLDTFDYMAFLEFLQSYNHNFFRLWAWDLLTWNTGGNNEENIQLLEITPKPWLRTGPGNALDGKPKFDLSRINPAYFDRLKERVKAAEEANMYVAVMLFEGWGLQFSPDAFRNHPFHSQNNINEIELDIEQESDKLSIYELGNEKITRLQEAYVRKVIETVGDQDNIIYEISNENHPLSTDWHYHMIRYIKEVESGRGKSHPVGMTFQYKGGNNQALFDSPADWISPNPEGGYRDNPPVSTGDKVIVTDTDHLWGIGGNRKWVWKSFLRGLNPIFMDPYDGKVLEKGAGSEWAEDVRVAMGYTKRFADRMDLINAVPSTTVASSGYCLANRGKEYLVYIPEGGEVEINLTSVTGQFAIEWFDPVSGNSQGGEAVEGGSRITLVSPFESGEAVVYIR